MRKLETYGSIRKDEKTGKNRLFIHKRDLFDKGIEFMPECRVRITVEKLYKKRSTYTIHEDGSTGKGQNGYYWHILLYEEAKALTEQYGEYFDIEKAHEFNKVNYWGKKCVNEKTGEFFTIPGSSADKSTVEFEEVLERIRQDIFTYTGHQIPLPGEQAEIEL